MKNKPFLRIIILFFIIYSCHTDKTKLYSSDYRIFKDTPAWKLAKYVRSNDTEGIREEIQNNPNIINYQEPMYGMSLLHLSIYNDDYQSFLQLLNLKANTEVYEEMHGETPLMIAIGLKEDKYFKYIEKLIEHGANVNNVGKNIEDIQEVTEKTALMHAAGQGNKKAVKYLLEHKADINFVGPKHDTALGYAMLGEHYDIAYFLLQNGADCKLILYNRYDEYGNEVPVYLKDLLSTDENFKNSKFYFPIKQKAKELHCR